MVRPANGKQAAWYDSRCKQSRGAHLVVANHPYVLPQTDGCALCVEIYGVRLPGKLGLADLCQILFSCDGIRCDENYLLFKGLSLNCLHQVFNASVAHVIEAIAD